MANFPCKFGLFSFMIIWPFLEGAWGQIWPFYIFWTWQPWPVLVFSCQTIFRSERYVWWWSIREMQWVCLICIWCKVATWHLLLSRVVIMCQQKWRFSWNGWMENRWQEKWEGKITLFLTLVWQLLLCTKRVFYPPPPIHFPKNCHQKVSEFMAENI